MIFMVLRFSRGNFHIRGHKSLICQQSKFQLQQSFSCGFKIGLISSQHVCGDSMIGSIHFNSLPDLSADWNLHKHDHRGNKIPQFYHFSQCHSVIPILQEVCF